MFDTLRPAKYISQPNKVQTRKVGTMATDRLLDLMKQGFMKPRKAARKNSSEKSFVSCAKCQDWHRAGGCRAHQKALNDIRTAQQGKS